jgi:hypothetical protein
MLSACGHKHFVFQTRIKISPEHLNKDMDMFSPQLSEDDADPVTTAADITCSPSTPTVTDYRHIGGNETDDALAVRDSFGDFFASPQCPSTGNWT